MVSASSRSWPRAMRMPAINACSGARSSGVSLIVRLSSRSLFPRSVSCRNPARSDIDQLPLVEGELAAVNVGDDTSDGGDDLGRAVRGVAEDERRRFLAVAAAGAEGDVASRPDRFDGR